MVLFQSALVIALGLLLEVTESFLFPIGITKLAQPAWCHSNKGFEAFDHSQQHALSLPKSDILRLDVLDVIEIQDNKDDNEDNHAQKNAKDSYRGELHNAVSQTEQPGELTQRLRERQNFAEAEIARILAETISLQKQIISWNQNITFIQKASEILMEYIHSEKLKNIVLEPHIASDVFEQRAMFNQVLKRHGFVLSATSIVEQDEGPITAATAVDLCLISKKGEKGLWQRIQSWWRGNKDGESTKQTNTTQIEMIQLTKHAVSRKTHEALEIQSLKTQIADAESQMKWNGWQVRYIKMASFCSFQLLQCGHLANLDIDEFEDKSIARKLCEEYTGATTTEESYHIPIFQTCLERYGLSFVGIRGNDAKDSYSVDLDYLPEPLDGGETSAHSPDKI